MPVRISVIMANYNKEAYIESAIQSVLSQSIQDFELIIVDDCSTDSSREIIKRFESADRRIIFLEKPRNMGLPSARNTAIRAAKSPILTLLDSDDLYSNDRLQRISEHIKEGSLMSPIYSDPVYIEAKTSDFSSFRSEAPCRPSGMILSSLLSGAFSFSGGTITMPKACFEEVGPYDETLTWGEDFDMCLRLAARFPFVYEPFSTYGYRIYQQNWMRRISKKERWTRQSQILEKHLLRNIASLDSSSAKRSFDYLFACYVASGQWFKILQYGFTKNSGFRSLATMLPRALHNHSIVRGPSNGVKLQKQ